MNQPQAKPSAHSPTAKTRAPKLSSPAHPRLLLALFKRELQAFFYTPMAYIIIFCFLLLNGLTSYFYLLSFYGNLEVLLVSQYGQIPFWFMLLLLPSLISMRSFAEERRAGTFETLVTTGIPDAYLVLSKFAANWAFNLVLWGLSLPILFLLEQDGDLDWGVVKCIFLGIAMFTMLLSSIGVFTSALSKNQIVSASMSLLIALCFFFSHSLRSLYPAGDPILRLFDYISPLFHFQHDFVRGIFGLRYGVLFASLSLFFLFLSTKVLEHRRWW